jgi:hypothetical protein
MEIKDTNKVSLWWFPYETVVVSCTETGTAARWFLRVSFVEPLAAFPVSVQDTVHSGQNRMKNRKTNEKTVVLIKTKKNQLQVKT